MFLPPDGLGPYAATDKNPVATVERVDNGFMIELHDMVDEHPRPDPAGGGMEFIGPDGAVSGAMRPIDSYARPPQLRPRARKFIARDLSEMQSRLADFFGDTAPHPHDQQQR